MAEESVGSLVVQLLFKTNAGEVLGQISGFTVTSAADLDKLLTKIQTIPIVLNSSNPAIAEFQTNLENTREAVAPLVSSLQKVSETSTGNIFKSTTEAGKEFTVTINKTTDELATETGAIVSDTEAAQKNAQGREQLAAVTKEESAAISQTGNISQVATKQITQAIEVEKISIAELQGRLADAQLQLSKTFDPTKAQQLEKTIQELKSQIANFKVGISSEGLGTIQKLELALKNARMELAALNLEMNPARANELTSSIRIMERDLANMTGKGVVFARQEFRNLRFEHFAVQQGLISLLFLFNSFSTENASNETKKFKQSMEGALGTALSLQLAMNALLPGVDALTQGIIGLSVGALVGLIAYFNQTNEAAKKATEEGIKEFNDAIKKLSEQEQIKITAQIVIDKTQAEKEIKDILNNAPKVIVQGAQFEREIPNLTPEQQKRIDFLKNQIDLQDQLKKSTDEVIESEKKKKEVQDLSNKLLEGHLSIQEELEIKIKKLKVEQSQITAKDEFLFGDKIISGRELIRKKEDEIKILEKERHDITLSTVETQKQEIMEAEKNLNIAEDTNTNINQAETIYRKILETVLKQTTDLDLQHQIRQKLVALQGEELTSLKEQRISQKLSSDEYISQLNILLLSTINIKQRLAIETAIKDEVSEQTRLLSEQQEARNKLRDIRQKAESESILSEYEKKNSQEEDRHKKILENINIEGIKASEIFVGPTPTGAVIIGEDVRKAQEAEDKRHQSELYRIEIERESQILKLKQEGTKHDEQAIIANYNLEVRFIKATEKDEIIKNEKIAALERRTQQEISDLQLKNLDEAIDAVDKIGNALHRAFSKGGDEFIQKMLAALQIVLQIEKAIEKATAGGGGIGEVLNVIGTGLSILSLLGFDEGGYTGTGKVDEPAGIVHKGEIVFEKPIVDHNKESLLKLREILIRGTPIIIQTMPQNTSEHYSSKLDKQITKLQSYQSGGYVGMVVPSIVHDMFKQSNIQETIIKIADLDPIVKELSALRGENKQLRNELSKKDFSPKIEIQGTLEGQSFLKKEMPKYQTFDKLKRV